MKKNRLILWGMLIAFGLLIWLLPAGTALADTPYGIWVEGIQVTSANAANVLGDGTVSYDDATKTLTLNGANLKNKDLPKEVTEFLGREDLQSNAIFAKEPITLLLKGNNTITISTPAEEGRTIEGIFFTEQATITSAENETGNLKICGGGATWSLSGIWVNNYHNLTIENKAEISVELDKTKVDSEDNIISGVFVSDSLYVGNEAKLGVKLNSDEDTVIGISANVNLELKEKSEVEIFIQGERCSGIIVRNNKFIMSNQAKLIVAIDTDIGALSWMKIDFVDYDKPLVKVGKSADGSDVSLWDGTTKLHGFSSPYHYVSVEPGTYVIAFDYNYPDAPAPIMLGTDSSGNLGDLPKVTRPGHKHTGWNTSPDGTGTDVTSSIFSGNTTLYAKWEKAYDVWVEGIRITPANSDNVLGDGKVSYDADRETLVLKNVNLKNQNVTLAGASWNPCSAAIFADAPLKIELQGDNTITIDKNSMYPTGGIIGKGRNMIQIGGSGRLNISGHIEDGLVTHFNGISSDGDFEIGDNAQLNISIKNDGEYTSAIETIGDIIIKDKAVVDVYAQGSKAKGFRAILGSCYVEDFASVTIAGDHYALYRPVYFIKHKNPIILIGTKTDGSDAQRWEGYSPFEMGSSYKYVKVRAPLYTITFDDNYSTNLIIKEYYANEKAIFPDPPIREGYRFKGWNTARNGSGSYITEEHIFNSDTTLYAQWTNIEGGVYMIHSYFFDTLTCLQVNFDLNYAGAPAAESKCADKNGKFAQLPAPKREGYLFLGWFKDKYGSGTAITADHVFTNDETVYAKWKNVKDSLRVIMTIGSHDYLVNDVTKTMDTVPFIEKDRTFVPIRALAEAFGAEVIWDGNERSVTIKDGDKTVIMTIGEMSYRVNDEIKEMDVAPFINTDDRTMIPVRFVTESLGYLVDYQQKDGVAKVIFTRD